MRKRTINTGAILQKINDALDILDYCDIPDGCTVKGDLLNAYDALFDHDCKYTFEYCPEEYGA